MPLKTALNLKIGRNPVAQVLYITLPRSPKDEIATEGRLFQTHDLATRAAIVSKVKLTQQLSNLVSVAACRKRQPLPSDHARRKGLAPTSPPVHTKLATRATEANASKESCQNPTRAGPLSVVL